MHGSRRAAHRSRSAAGIHLHDNDVDESERFLPATFEALGLSSDLVAALARDGIAIQALTIPDALAGRDLCGKAKTGSGKTLAFGLPLLERIQPGVPRRPRGLVLTPTRELANQVKTVLAPLAKLRKSRVTAVYARRGPTPSSVRPGGSSTCSSGKRCRWPTSRSS
jgi:superfamily II DNA/RNA helicase